MKIQLGEPSSPLWKSGDVSEGHVRKISISTLLPKHDNRKCGKFCWKSFPIAGWLVILSTSTANTGLSSMCCSSLLREATSCRAAGGGTYRHSRRRCNAGGAQFALPAHHSWWDFGSWKWNSWILPTSSMLYFSWKKLCRKAPGCTSFVLKAFSSRFLLDLKYGGSQNLE